MAFTGLKAPRQQSSRGRLAKLHNARLAHSGIRKSIFRLRALINN
jgi:hypothetical protein